MDGRWIDSKDIKKDQHSVRDTRDELQEEVRAGGTQPRLTHPNRDRARGDWDRTGDHHDADPNRSDEE